VGREQDPVQETKLSEVLSDFARILATNFPIQRILDQLVESIVEVLPITSAGVTLISAGEAPHHVAASNEAALRYEQLQSETGDGPCILAYESGDAVSVPDLAKDERFGRFRPQALEAGLVAVFTFPMHQEEARLGALDLYRDTTGALEPHAMHVAQTLADVAAAYLINARSREDALSAAAKFEHQSLHDPLTGLPNRRALQDRLEHAAERARRSHTNAAIVFVDLDGFKTVNDTHGHRVGDELLVAVAERLSSILRAGDTLVRLGGDEFVIFCEDLADPSDVELLTTRISTAFERPFELAGTEITITASVGVAFAGPGEAIADDLLITADRAMYRAKRTGGGSEIIDLRAAIEGAQ
jgi:diguanylate cyclase (GGDEF)-like protein